MAASLFVKIADVDGDATEGESDDGVTGHQKWIVIKTMSMGVERAVDMADLGSSQRGYANANFQKIAVTSEMSIASTKLFELSANGLNKGDIKVHCCRATDDAARGLDTYLELILTNGQVCKYDVSFSEDGVPEENWEMAYREIDVNYTHINPDTFEKAATPISFTWNLKTGKPR